MTTKNHFSALQAAQSDSQISRVEYVKSSHGRIGKTIYALLVRLFKCEENNIEANIRFNDNLLVFLAQYNEYREAYRDREFINEIADRLGLNAHQRGGFSSSISALSWELYRTGDSEMKVQRMRETLRLLSEKEIEES